MDWNLVTAVATAVVLAVSAFIAIRQLKQIRRAGQTDAFRNLIELLQREDIREARNVLIEELSKKDFKNWSKDERRQAEKACHTYNTAGVMAARNLPEKDFIAKKNRSSIIKCWRAAQPMIKEYRKERGEDFWEDFEELYKGAKKIKERHKKA